MAFPTAPAGVALEKEHALQDSAQAIMEYGDQITIRLYGEPEVERDNFNSIIRKGVGSPQEITLHTYPTLYNPTEKELIKARIKESVAVLLKTSVWEWESKGVDMETLRNIDSIRAEVVLRGETYGIKTKQFDSQVQDIFLYVHLGLDKV
jgi:hypothetical protein